MKRLLAFVIVLALVTAAPLAAAGSAKARAPAHADRGKPTSPSPPVDGPPASSAPGPSLPPAPVARHVAPNPGPPASPSTAALSAPTPAPASSDITSFNLIAPTVHRVETFDMAGGAAPLSAASTEAFVGGAVAVAAAVPVPFHGAWVYGLPLLGMFGLGAALLLRPPRPRAPRAAKDAEAPAAVPVTPARPLALTLSPVDVRALLKTGKSAVERGNLGEAVAWFTQVLTIEPRLSVAHFAKGVCLAGLGRHDEAYEALESAYAIDPNEGAIRLEFARAAARTARPGLAMDALGPLLRVLPQLADDVIDDEAFASLFDHPRFLAMTGRL